MYDMIEMEIAKQECISQGFDMTAKAIERLMELFVEHEIRNCEDYSVHHERGWRPSD